MNGKLILMLGALGAVEAVASLAGILRSGVEGYVTAAVTVVIGVIAGLRSPGKPFLHGLLAGGLANVVGPVLQAAFFDRYLSLNPNATAAFASLPAQLSPRVLVLVLSPVLGVCFGLCSGLVAWITAKVARRSPKAPEPA